VRARGARRTRARARDFLADPLENPNFHRKINNSVEIIIFPQEFLWKSVGISKNLIDFRWNL
jgi:hypothetical protein